MDSTPIVETSTRGMDDTTSFGTTQTLIYSSSTTMVVNDTSTFLRQDEECGNFDTSVGLYRFWCDGVFVSAAATIGFTGNLLALVVLTRPKLKDVFHQLLLALALFDLLYIICGGINYTFRAFQAESNIFTYLFPYFLYPMTHVSMAGTIFMTLAISIERYLGLCHPMLPPHSRKAWMYIVPVVVVSVALNIPKFMEVELNIKVDDDGVSYPSYGHTSLRFNETYIRVYIMWIRLFSTALIPVTLMLYFNSCIVIDLCSSKVQRFGSDRYQSKEINLCFMLLAIVVIFFLCHAVRITLDVYEFTFVEKVITCRPWFPPYWAQVLPFISHLTMIINSSVNFFVYCMVGRSFRREMCKTFGLKCYQPLTQQSEISRNPNFKNGRFLVGNGSVNTNRVPNGLGSVSSKSSPPAKGGTTLSEFDLKSALDIEKVAINRAKQMEQSEEIMMCP